MFLAAALLMGCDNSNVPTPLTAQPVLTFTATHATNALNHTRKLVTTCTPRDAGTPGAEQAAEWIRDQLAATGITTRVDRFYEKTPRGEKPFVNVLASLPGQSDEWIVLLSHFDTMSGIGPGFQGANDSGSSTGLLIELATLLQASPPLKHNILCGFMDGEECMIAYGPHDGFHGSKHLALALKQAKTKIRAVILMDMIGDRDLKITVPHNGTPALRLLSLKAAEASGVRDQIGLFDGIIYDDHQAFLDLGYPAVNLIDFSFGSRPELNDYWHTPKDTLDKLAVESFLTTGRIVIEMLNQL